jgi:uncharacterized cupin superfamily protein
MPIIEKPDDLPARRGTIYPAPLDEGFEGRVKRSLTQALGLSQFGVNLTTLEPGAKSSHRHWHAHEDECIYVVSGEVTLILDDGAHRLTAGMVAGFPAGDTNAHHLVNLSAQPATYLEIGSRSDVESATYADVDLRAEKSGGVYRFLHKNGTPYE